MNARQRAAGVTWGDGRGRRGEKMRRSVRAAGADMRGDEGNAQRASFARTRTIRVRLKDAAIRPPCDRDSIGSRLSDRSVQLRHDARAILVRLDPHPL